MHVKYKKLPIEYFILFTNIENYIGGKIIQNINLINLNTKIPISIYIKSINYQLIFNYVKILQKY